MPVRIKDLADPLLKAAATRLQARQARIDQHAAKILKGIALRLDTEARRRKFQRRERRLEKLHGPPPTPPARKAAPPVLDPERFFLTSKALDFTLVAVKEIDENHEYGWLPLLAEKGKILIGNSVNIIQHPDGEDKKVVTQNSHLLDLEDAAGVSNFCWYDGDTEQGSSGAPVLNNRWEVVALHRKAVPKVNKNEEVVDVNGRRRSHSRPSIGLPRAAAR